MPLSCTGQPPSLLEDERSQLVRILVVYQLPQEESGTKHERQHLPEEGGGQRLRRACRAEALRRRRRLPRRRRTATMMNTTRPISHVRLMPSSSLPAPSYPPPPASCAAPCNGRSCAVRGRADAAKAALQGCSVWAHLAQVARELEQHVVAHGRIGLRHVRSVQRLSFLRRQCLLQEPRPRRVHIARSHLGCCI